MRPMMVMLHGKRSIGGGGGGGSFVSISNLSLTDEANSPETASAFLRLNSDGSSTTNFGDGSDWLLGSTTGSDYEARATVTSGTLSSGTTGSWLALSSNRTWTVSRSSLGTKTATFTLEIRDVATSTVQDTASITLTATVEVGA